ncbi:MAG: hypothetical protein ABI623_00075 [bacterium]
MNRISVVTSAFMLIVVLNVDSGFSQENTSAYSSDTFPSYLIFAEAGGHGLASINCEYYFSHRVGLRVGYGIYVPVLLNFYFGQRYLLELGAGMMFTQYNVVESFQGKQKTLLLGCTIGHKFQPVEGGVTLRYSFTPMFNPSNGKFLPMFGLSLGVAFK